MPRLTCPDGHQISLSPLPNPHGYLMIREPAVEPLVDALVDTCAAMTAEEDFAVRALEALSTRSPGIMQAYECPVCGRIAIFANASDRVPIAWYRREP